jgi:hypothetical protein
MRVPDNANKPGAVVRGVCAPYNAWELAEYCDGEEDAQEMGGWADPCLAGLAAPGGLPSFKVSAALGGVPLGAQVGLQPCDPLSRRQGCSRAIACG